jgi:hypothetical protein
MPWTAWTPGSVKSCIALRNHLPSLPPPFATNYRASDYNPFIQSFNYRLSGKINIKHCLLKVGLICSLPKPKVCALPFHFQSTFCIPVQSLMLKNNSSRHRYQHFVSFVRFFYSLPSSSTFALMPPF